MVQYIRSEGLKHSSVLLQIVTDSMLNVARLHATCIESGDDSVGLLRADCGKSFPLDCILTYTLAWSSADRLSPILAHTAAF